MQNSESRRVRPDDSKTRLSKETDPPAHARGIEHFWLCAECSARMTLCLDQDGTVATTGLPDSILSAPQVELNPMNRENRRFLSRVSFLPRSHPKGT